LPTNFPLAPTLHLPPLDPTRMRNVPLASPLPDLVPSMALPRLERCKLPIDPIFEPRCSHETPSTPASSEKNSGDTLPPNGPLLVATPSLPDFPVFKSPFASCPMPRLEPLARQTLERPSFGPPLLLPTLPSAHSVQHHPADAMDPKLDESSNFASETSIKECDMENEAVHLESSPCEPTTSLYPDMPVKFERPDNCTSIPEVDIGKNKDSSPTARHRFATLERPSTRLFSTLATSSTPGIVNLLKVISPKADIAEHHMGAQQRTPQTSALSADVASALPLQSPSLLVNHTENTAVEPLILMMTTTTPLPAVEGIDILDISTVSPTVSLDDDPSPAISQQCTLDLGASEALCEDGTPRVEVITPPRLDSSSPLSGALSTINHLLDLTSNINQAGATIPTVEEAIEQDEPQPSEECEERYAEATGDDTSFETSLVISKPSASTLLSTHFNTNPLSLSHLPPIELSFEAVLGSSFSDPLQLYAAARRALAAGINGLACSSLLFSQFTLAFSMALHGDAVTARHCPLSRSQLTPAPASIKLRQIATLDSVEFVEDRYLELEPAAKVACSVEEPDELFERGVPSGDLIEVSNVDIQNNRGCGPYSHDLHPLSSGPSLNVAPLFTGILPPLSIPVFPPRSSSFSLCEHDSFNAPAAQWDPDCSVSESVTFEQHPDLQSSQTSSISDSQGPRTFSKDTLNQIRSQLYVWMVNPTPETCPMGVQFLASLVTAAARPKKEPFPYPQRNAARSSDIPSPKLYSPNQKKRRITLHPMSIEAPPSKISKR